MAPRKVWPQVAPEKLMQLRSNRSAAPGSPDKPRAKKTSAQVAKEKAAKEDKKRTAAEAQEAKRQAVLDKEKEMRARIKESDRVADHPPPNATKKASRPDAPDKKDAENRKGEKLEQATLRRLTRQETTEVPETEGEQLYSCRVTDLATYFSSGGNDH